MCVCLSVCAHSGPVNQTSLKWELNANSSKTVKATDFFRKGGVCKNSLGGDMHSHKRLLVIMSVYERASLTDG